VIIFFAKNHFRAGKMLTAEGGEHKIRNVETTIIFLKNF